MFQQWRMTFIVAAIAAATFCTGLGLTRLWDVDEPMNAVCGQEMFARGDWIVPTFNGQLRTDKPILIYWCMIAVYHFLGVTEMAARLPSALAGIGTIVLTFHLGRLMFDRRTGLVASCLASSALMFAVLARGATPDSLLIVCITASITSFVAGVAKRRGGHFSGTLDGRGTPTPVQAHGLPVLACVGMYVSMGLAVLAKGPIGVVMPLGIIGCYLLFFDDVEAAPADAGWLRRVVRYFAPRRILSIARTLRLGWGLPLVALVALPWYIMVGIRTNGEWITGFLGTHNVGRFMHPMEHHRGLPIYYVVAIFAGFFPGSVFLPVGLWSMITFIRRNNARRGAAAFLLCWIGCYVGFFTFAATKLPNYVVPCYPALAIATGYWLSAMIDRAAVRDWRLWAGYGSFVGVGVIIAVAVAIVARVLLKLDPLPALPGIVAVIGGIASLMLLYRGRVGGSVGAFLVTCFLFTLSAMTYTAWRASELEDGPMLAEQIHTLIDTQSHAAPHVATLRYSCPSLVFYLGNTVERLGAPGEIPAFFEGGGDALVMSRTAYENCRDQLPSTLAVLAETQRFMKRRESVVIVGRSTELARGDARDEVR
ncbi:MAG TPA: glycosyltransferase family 39 protein [Lacipirellulaceae bacterium]|nr:glycosyltransferase family 39 protein [Lacipirellulaceae bacterium]